MKHKKIHIALAVAVCLAVPAAAQQGIDAVLDSVARNNKTLKARQGYWEAQKLLYRTGNTPYDPTVSYDFMRGSPQDVAGNQTDITVTQAFDFPSVYGRKAAVADEHDRQADFGISTARQEILLDAKLVCLELVYRNRLQAQLAERVAKTETYRDDFREKLEKGFGNVLDVNKASLQLIELNRQQRENAAAIKRLNEQLAALNGGKTIAFTDTVYPAEEPVPEFGLLIAEMENRDTARLYLQQQAVVSGKQVEVARALALPRFEVGYHYQAILGQTFSGVRLGMSIPLWEKRNRVRQRKAEQLAAEVRVDEHRVAHHAEMRQLHTTHLNTSTTLDEYRSVLDGMQGVALLDKALALGEMTTIEYFLETGYFYQAMDNYLEVEMDYHRALAELYKYRL